MKTNNDQSYKPTDRQIWQGRSSVDGYTNQYWHEAILFDDVDRINESKKYDVGVHGFVCDEGVRRNQGRVGAANGPKKIRERLSKLAFHLQKSVVDLGDVVCVGSEMELAQQELSRRTALLISKGIFSFVLGGGHEVAFGHGEGVIAGAKKLGKNKIGIINFDAHFDLRPSHEISHSGSPFYQLLKKYPTEIEYMAIGIQKESNPQQLFDIAQEHKVGYILNTSCVESQISSILQEVEEFIHKQDAIYISIDLDGFSSNFAPGVSAPSPMGFSPLFVLTILENILATQKVLACDIAELNPKYDIDNCTANLAARLINSICGALA